MKKVKLIFFHPYSFGGGSDNSLYRLIKKLNKKIYDIDFISLNKSILNNKITDINFIKLNSSRTILSIFEIRKILKKYQKKNKYKKIIMISNQNFANLVAIFSKYKLSFIKLITVDRNHIDELYFFKNYLDFIKKKTILILMKFFYKKADVRIGISKKLSKDLSKHVKSKINTVYSPSYDKSIIELAKKQNVKLKKNEKFFICVSRFSKRKDHNTLLAAFSMIKIKKKFKLILVGFGPEEQNIKLLIKKYNLENEVLMIKNLHNPFWLIKKSSLLIVTSVYEGFPNVIVEALTLGTPVISTNMNAGASEILLNGRGGDLVKVGDVLNLSKKISHFIANPSKLKNKMLTARKNLFRFDVESHHKIYNKIFKNV